MLPRDARRCVFVRSLLSGRSMSATITVSEATLELLVQERSRANAKSLDNLIRMLVVEHRRAKLRDAQARVQARMRELGLKADDVLPGYDPNEL